MSSYFGGFFGVCLFIAGMTLIFLMGFDALEYEMTGECRDCVVLPHLAERFK